MAGAKKIKAIEPEIVFTHCYRHALNIGLGNYQESSHRGDCLDTWFELKLIKFSPKREAMLHLMKKDI